MIWISNGDPPIYVWPGDEWYNQKDKCIYTANINKQGWDGPTFVPFTKKTRILKLK